MNRKSLTFGESNVAALSAFFGMAGGTLIFTAVASVADIWTDGAFSKSGGYDAALMVLTQVLMFAGAFFYLSVFRRVNYFKLFSFGIDKLNAKKVGLLLLITVGAVLLFAPFAEFFVWILTLFGYNSVGEIPSGGGFLLTVVAAAVFPAVFEEMLFRGVYLNGSRRRGAFFALTYGAFVFMIYHGNPMQTVYQFFLGLILAYLAIVSGHIGYGIVVHFANNLIAILLGFIPFGKLSAGWAAFMYIVWIFAGMIILIPSLKTFARMNAKERNISLGKADGGAVGQSGFLEAAENSTAKQDGNSGSNDKKGFFEAVVFDITETFSKIAALLTKKETLKENIEKFNSRYDKTNEFDEEIPPDAIFTFGKDEGKRLPVSAILLIIGFASMWLLVFVFGFLNIKI
jgi:membrane protease YdiL (CAAX protease family)